MPFKSLFTTIGGSSRDFVCFPVDQHPWCPGWFSSTVIIVRWLCGTIDRTPIPLQILVVAWIESRCWSRLQSLAYVRGQLQEPKFRDVWGRRCLQWAGVYVGCRVRAEATVSKFELPNRPFPP